MQCGFDLPLEASQPVVGARRILIDFNIGTFLPDLKKRQDEIGKSLSPEEFVGLIRDLPDYWMEHQHGIRIDFSYQNQDSRLFKFIRKEYRNKAKWLQLKMLNQLEIQFEVTNSSAYQYEFFAQRTVSFHQLASDVCFYKSSWANEQEIDPLLWTIYIEAQFCEISLRNSGYISESPCLIDAGKDAQYAWGLAHTNWLENVAGVSFDSGGDSPKGALEKHGALIGTQDREFQYTRYENYLKAQRRYHRCLRNSKFYGMYLGPDGNVQPINRGRDVRSSRPPKKHKRSFG